MAVNKEKVFVTINDLIETLKDGEMGYKSAVEGVKQNDLKELFNQYSNQRSDYINELQSLVFKLGGSPADSGSISGAMHRGWLDIKTAISSDNDQAVLNECERGEDVAVKEFEEALNVELPANIKNVVSEQYGNIKAAHDNIKRLRDHNKS